MGWHHLWTLWSRTTAGKALTGNEIHLFQSFPADLDCLGFYGKFCAGMTKLRSEGIPVKDKNGMWIPGFMDKILGFKKSQTTLNYDLSKWEHSLFMT